MLNQESIGGSAGLLATISLIGTGAYFVNYALTGRSAFLESKTNWQKALGANNDHF